jgi:hypothetical protein
MSLAGSLANRHQQTARGVENVVLQLIALTPQPQVLYGPADVKPGRMLVPFALAMSSGTFDHQRCDLFESGREPVLKGFFFHGVPIEYTRIAVLLLLESRHLDVISVLVSERAWCLDGVRSGNRRQGDLRQAVGGLSELLGDGCEPRDYSVQFGLALSLPFGPRW